MQVPEEEKYLNTKAELHDILVGLLGGRAAEEIVFDTVTTGASNDIEKATNIARAMVTQYGMSKRFGLMGLETVESKYLDGRTAMNCSDVTAAAVDEEVMKILKESYKEAKKMLKENRELMDKLAEHLIEKETITGKEFMKIFREEKGLPEPEEKPKPKALEDGAHSEKQAGSLGMTGWSGQNPTGQAGSFGITGQSEQNPTGQNAGMRTDTHISGNMPDYEREQLLRNAWPQIRGLQEQDGTAPKSEDTQEVSPKVENEFAEALRNRSYARKDEQNETGGEQGNQK